jgi:hypothetical protein
VAASSFGGCFRLTQNLSYAYEKLSQAVFLLATGEGDVRSRLRAAYLEFSAVLPDSLPENLQEDFEWIRSELTKRDARFPGDGKLDATLFRMQNRTGKKIAERIFELVQKVQRIYERS